MLTESFYLLACFRSFLCCSVAKSCPTLRLHGLQHARLLCPPLSSRVCANSCTLSLWYYLTISSSAAPSFAFSFPSIWVFSNESAFHTRWTKYWSFGFSISPSNEYSRLISFRLYWFDLLAIQGTLKSLLQHHSLKASIFGTQPFLWFSSLVHDSILNVYIEGA